MNGFFSTRRATAVLWLHVLLIFGVLSLSGCDDDDDDGDTTPPTVTLSVPDDPLRGTVSLSADASDDTGVTQVDFLADGVEIGSSTAAPYAIDWDTTTVEDGDYVLSARAHDAEGNSGDSASVTAAVDNVVEFAATLEGAQEVPTVATSASGTTDLAVDLVTGAVSGQVQVEGLVPTAAHIHAGIAGTSGGVVLALAIDAGDPTLLTVPDGSVMTADSLELLLAGGLYVNVHSANFPAGEIRAQLLLDAQELAISPLSGTQVLPPVATDASGSVSTTTDTVSGAMTLVVNLSGADDASEVALYSGAPDEDGSEISGLTADDANPGRWIGDVVLDADQLDAYAEGGLFVLVVTPGEPSGLLRGRILPPGLELADTTPPTVSLEALPASVSGTVTLEATASDDVAVAEVRFFAGESTIGSDDSAPYAIDWDSTSVADGNVDLTAEAVDTAGNTSMSDPVTVAVSNAPASTVKLADLQADVFTPQCSGCHSGGGGSLPASMDLTSTEASYAALVGVASEQVPALQRVEAGNADDSYLIHKVEGTQSVGSQMPVGGSFLSESTIAMIREWIDAGAPAD